MLNAERWLGTAILCLTLTSCKDLSSPVIDFSPLVEPSRQPAQDVKIGDAAPVEIALAERKLPLVAIRECNLERIDGQLFSTLPVDVAKSGSVTFSGWIASTEAKNVPGILQIRLVNVTDNRAWAIAGNTGQSREDVRKLLGGHGGYAGAGFSLKLDALSMPMGTYRLFTVFEEGNSLKSCDNGRSIRILG
jgi:hypothetical protein